MSWIDTLLGRKSYNPELYDRVQCEACNGTGLPTWGGRPHPSRRGERAACPQCGGKGYTLVKKPDTV
jgi:DnaJ-class molecular chaperone